MPPRGRAPQHSRFRPASLPALWRPCISTDPRPRSDQPTGRLALVFELLDVNLYELIRGRRHYLDPEMVRWIMFEIITALDHMHCKGIFHRDIKPEK